MQVIFETGFHYYSQGYDLSLPLLLNKVNSASPQQRNYYDQFIWNHNLMTADGQKDMTELKIFWNWCDKMIQGYIC